MSAPHEHTEQAAWSHPSPPAVSRSLGLESTHACTLRCAPRCSGAWLRQLVGSRAKTPPQHETKRAYSYRGPRNATFDGRKVDSTRRWSTGSISPPRSISHSLSPPGRPCAAVVVNSIASLPPPGPPRLTASSRSVTVDRIRTLDRHSSPIGPSDWIVSRQRLGAPAAIPELSSICSGDAMRLASTKVVYNFMSPPPLQPGGPCGQTHKGGRSARWHAVSLRCLCPRLAVYGPSTWYVGTAMFLLINWSSLRSSLLCVHSS